MTELVKDKIVIIDDDVTILELLDSYLKNQGYEVICFQSAIEALQAFNPEGNSSFDSNGIDVVISDIKMPHMDGLEFTVKLLEYRKDIPIILMTAFGSIETAVEAIRMGAFDYIIKPFKLVEFLVNIERAKAHRKLDSDNNALRKELTRSHNMENMIGKSKEMQAIFDLINRVAKVNTNVLITGESGTGKELVAQAIHQKSERNQKPFIAINCAAIPETLLESELFGHAKGAFTGATQRKLGLFEEAEGGTIFLDEIGDMNMNLQAKLLRVIQEKQVRCVGENTSRDLDVRIITATHKNLRLAMKEGHFREDLFYRLNIIQIEIPPLRNRKEDIPALAEYFLKKYSASNKLNVKGFTKKAMLKLMSMRWDGNVRELANAIERASILCASNHIEDQDIPSPCEDNLFLQNSIQDFPTLEEMERRYVELVLDKTGFRKDKAAEILGINRRTLYRKEQEYGLYKNEQEVSDILTEDALKE